MFNDSGNPRKGNSIVEFTIHINNRAITTCAYTTYRFEAEIAITGGLSLPDFQYFLHFMQYSR